MRKFIGLALLAGWVTLVVRNFAMVLLTGAWLLWQSHPDNGHEERIQVPPEYEQAPPSNGRTWRDVPIGDGTASSTGKAAIEHGQAVTGHFAKPPPPIRQESTGRGRRGR